MPPFIIDTSAMGARGSSSSVRSPISSPVSVRLDPWIHQEDRAQHHRSELTNRSRTNAGARTSPYTMIAKLQWDHLEEMEKLEFDQRGQEMTMRRIHLLRHKELEEQLLQQPSNGLSRQHHEFVCEILECHKYRLPQTEMTKRLESKKEALDQAREDLIAELTEERVQLRSRQERDLAALQASQKIQLDTLRQAYGERKAKVLSRSNPGGS